MSLIPTLFFSLLHLCFLIFSTGSGVAQKVTQDQPDISIQVGESHRFGVVCICAARHSKTLNSQLEAELSTFVKGNPRLMPLSSLLWVFLVITFSGREASKRGCECSG